MEEDIFYTIEEPAESASRERSSKFLSFAYPVMDQDQIKEHLDALRKRYYDATHHCYAWRLGAKGELSRANDDGEPSSTAGKPILGQLLSNDLTNILVVVVRYFGGTKLGVSGLIAAYKDSAAEVIAECKVVERTIDESFEIEFPYIEMNEVMRAIKELEPTIEKQNFDNTCTMTLSIRKSMAERLRQKIENYIVEPSEQ